MKALPMPHTTARELLEYVAGEEHATHSVTRRKHSLRMSTISITCSCGEKFKVGSTLEVKAALRNVPEGM